MAQRVTTSGTTIDNEWQQVKTNDSEWQQVKTNYKEWQRVTILGNFSFFQIREEPTTKHPNEKSLNLEEDLRRGSIELRAETSP